MTLSTLCSVQLAMFLSLTLRTGLIKWYVLPHFLTLTSMLCLSGWPTQMLWTLSVLHGQTMPRTLFTSSPPCSTSSLRKGRGESYGNIWGLFFLGKGQFCFDANVSFLHAVLVGFCCCCFVLKYTHVEYTVAGSCHWRTMMRGKCLQRRSAGRHNRWRTCFWIWHPDR